MDLSNPRQAQVALRDLQEKLESFGHVPRDAMQRVEARMRAAEQRVRDALDAEWKRGAPESNPFLAQLKERLAEAEAKLAKAQASGDPQRIAKAEAEVNQRQVVDPGVAARRLEPAGARWSATAEPGSWPWPMLRWPRR